jgi:hypothetical protein
MARNSAEQQKEVTDPSSENRDSKSITDLIEQIERDLRKTRKKAARES